MAVISSKARTVPAAAAVYQAWAFSDTTEGWGIISRPTGPHSSSLFFFPDLLRLWLSSRAEKQGQSRGEHSSVTASLMAGMKRAKRPNKREADRQKHPDKHVDFSKILDTQKYKDMTPPLMLESIRIYWYGPWHTLGFVYIILCISGTSLWSGWCYPPCTVQDPESQCSK